MDVARDLQVIDDLAIYAPLGEVTLQKSIDLVVVAISSVVERKIPYLMINLLGLAGYGIPSLGERYFMSQAWAQAAAGKVVIAMVAPADHIDRDKFGSKVARTRGTTNDVFASEAAARSWLRDQGCQGAADKSR